MLARILRTAKSLGPSSLEGRDLAASDEARGPLKPATGNRVKSPSTKSQGIWPVCGISCGFLRKNKARAPRPEDEWVEAHGPREPGSNAKMWHSFFGRPWWECLRTLNQREISSFGAFVFLRQVHIELEVKLAGICGYGTTL